MMRVATRFRLNTSHLTPEELARHLHDLDVLFQDQGKTLPVVLDLQGAKVRIGQYPRVSQVPQKIELKYANESQTPDVIPIPHESVFQQAQVGDRLHLNDRKVMLKIIEKPAADRMIAVCLQSGELGPRKGLNCQEKAFELARVSQKDRDCIAIGNHFPWAEYAISFLCDGTEADLYRPLTAGRRLIAKIERPAALRNLTVIDEQFDELWLCRGDLGSELPLRELGAAQEAFVARFPDLHCPKILAGEVLGAMVYAPFPSRSEIVHLHDAFQRGFAGFVLSDETATGAQVPEVIRFLDAFFATEI
jgi:pyruvate kinase